MNDMTKMEPWQWPEAHWRGLVNQVRAGRSYRPKGWKGGARCAFALSFDSDHETNELRDGGKSIGRMAWGQYGNRVGVPSILKLLAKHSVPATFYVPAVAALLHGDEQRRVIAEGHEIGIHSWIHELNSVLPYEAEKDLMSRAADVLEKTTKVRPVGARTASWDFSPHTLRITKEMGLLYGDEQRRIIAEGHEIGIHSWIHELNSVLPYEAEKDLMLRASDVLEKTTGVRPVGARTASWDFSPHTLRITREAGLLYDSSLMADVDCYELLLDGEPTGVIEFPVEWIRDDAVYFMMHRFQGLRPYTPPADVFDVFRREFEAAYEEGGIFQLTCHPHIIGYRSRLWIIEELIRLAKAKGDVFFATHADVVRYARDHAVS